MLRSEEQVQVWQGNEYICMSCGEIRKYDSELGIVITDISGFLSIRW